MNKSDIIRALELLPNEVLAAEINYYKELDKLRELRNELAILEGDLLKDGKVKGSSDKVRTLQFTQLTKDKLFEIQRAEFSVDIAKATMNSKKNELESMQLIAKLM